MDIFLAAAMGRIDQIKARLAEDVSWLNAPFERVRPVPEKEWANDWAPPLWYAAMNGQIEAVKYLLQKGANAKATDSKNRSVADYAQEAGHSEIAELIKSVL